MSTDLDKIRQRLKVIEESTTSRKLLWKPEPGEQVVRIVPYIHNVDYPFIELYFHYNVGKKNFLSLKTFNEADPIVDFSEKLKQTGSSDDWKLGKKIEPKLRTFVPVLVRGHEKEGVKFWGFGKEIYMSLLTTISDPDWGDIAHPTTGRDVTVIFKTAEEANRSYPETTIRIKPKQTRVTEDREVAQLIKKQVDIFEVFKKPTFDDLQAELDAWLNPDEADDKPRVSQPASVSTPQQPQKPATTVASTQESVAPNLTDLDAEFDALLNQA